MPTEKTQRLILASASPRRLELLQTVAIIPQKTVPSNVQEGAIPKESPKNMVLRLACEKARAVAKTEKKAFILAADTTVTLGRRLLEKPEDAEEARRFLELLSGRRHKVYGGICVIAPDGRESSRVCLTSVQFKCLSDQEINAYVDSGEWEGKAGGYGIQGRAASFVKSINGSYSNVVGLSLYDTVNMLRGLGYDA